MIGLFRTGGPAETEKHKGLSQFLIDMRSSGIEVRPIQDLTGEAHFNEVTFDEVFVPDAMLVAARATAGRRPAPNSPSSAASPTAT